MSVLFFNFKEPDDFKNALSAARRIASPEQRTVEVKGVKYRLEQFADENNGISANVVRVREGLIPGRTRTDSDGVRDLDLDDGEYLGEETSLLFLFKPGILALQSNRFGIGSATLTVYLQQLLNQPNVPFPGLLYENELVLARMEKLVSPRTIDIELAHPSAKNLQDLGLSANGTIDFMTNVGAERISITLKSERGGVLSGARTLIRRLANFADKDEARVLRKARVQGRDEANDITVLDLLEPKMVETVPIRVEDTAKRVTHAQRLSGLRGAYATRKEAIKNLVAKE